jgi:hypothetical protein
LETSSERRSATRHRTPVSSWSRPASAGIPRSAVGEDLGQPRQRWPALLAEKVSEEVIELVVGLPEHEQEIVVVMLRALSDHVASAR